MNVMNSSSETWLDVISGFRRSRSPGQFLASRNVTTENFTLDILEALCNESAPEPVKLQLLLLLQEKSSSLLLETTSVECVVGSLKDLFQNSTGNLSQLFLSQVLVTITTVLVTSEMLKHHQGIFVDFVGIMTDIIEKVNTPGRLLIRRTACDCLWEIELSFPGLLQGKLDHLYTMCATECGSVFQSYMVLFVTVLEHAIQHLVMDPHTVPEDNCINELLTSRTEPLKPLYLPTPLSKEAFSLSIQYSLHGPAALLLPSNVDTRELKRAISFLMDNVGFLNTSGLCYVMRQLMCCVKLAELPSNIFKAPFIHLLPTADLRVLHLLLLLKATFSENMFEEHDEELLLQRLLLACGQPTLSHGQRLLCFEWLMYFDRCELDQGPPQPSVPRYLVHSQFSAFFPVVFDHLDIVQQKLKVLCLCGQLSPESHVPLVQCLVLLHKQVEHGVGGRVLVALFRLLFWYYKHHSDTDLVRSIYQYILSIVTDFPKVIAYTVDFLDSLTVVTPESTFPLDLLKALSKHIVSQPVSAVLPDLPHHLKLLSQAMRQADIAPAMTIRFLGKILEQSEVGKQGSWSLGNCVLAVCHNILLHQDTLAITRDLGDVLLLMCTTFRDIDITDRARFYYSLLTNVSSAKCSKVLAAEKTKQPLPHVIAGDITTSSFPVPPPVEHLEQPFLKLTRVCLPRSDVSLSSLVGCGDAHSSTGTRVRQGLLNEYLKAVSSATHLREIATVYYVHFMSAPVQLASDKIYALVLQFRTDKAYEELQDLHIPYLSTAKSKDPVEGCQRISVVFRPKEPVPAVFTVRAMFNNARGTPCCMSMEDLHIHFSDLFLPLELPASFISSDSPEAVLMSALFAELWKFLSETQKSSATPSEAGAESIVCLAADWPTTRAVVEERLLPFVLDSSESEIDVGIFLPPKQHLLLRFRPLNNRTVVSIATDDWRLLNLVGSYLRQLAGE